MNQRMICHLEERHARTSQFHLKLLHDSEWWLEATAILISAHAGDKDSAALTACLDSLH